MLKDIIKKEILDHLLSAKFLFMFIICSALILLSVYMGTGNYLADKKMYDEDISYDGLALSPPNTYSVILEGALKTYRAPRTLGALVKGVEDAAGRMSHVTQTEVGLGESKYESNPQAAVFGAFDLLFIVKMALSLFAVLLVFDAICGEREKGTLKLTLANSVPRDRLLLGKAIGGYISLCVPLLIPMLLSLIYLSLHPAIVLTGEDWQRLCFICLMFLLYLSVFFFLGLLVSSLTARSSTSLLILIFAWSVWGIVVPKAAVIIAGHLRPIPVPNEIYAQKTAFSNQLAQEMSLVLQQKQQDLRAQYDQTDAAARQELSRVLSELSREHNQERQRRLGENNEKIDRDYQMRKEAQAALAKNLSIISPSAALTFSATTLAQTGVGDYNRFVKAALDYKPVIAEWVSTNPDLREAPGASRPTVPGTNDAIATSGGTYKQIDPFTLAGMPQPAIEPEKLSRSIVRILPDLISMIVMIVLLMGGAYFAFIRCDVR